MPKTKERTYGDAEIRDKLRALPGWWLEGGMICRTYQTDGWPTTLMLVNAIGYLAEAAYHHPGSAWSLSRISASLYVRSLVFGMIVSLGATSPRRR